jgi:uncharacterized protein
MPRKVRIIANETEKEEVIKKCDCCYVGMVDEQNLPYVVPFNFGYRDKYIYLHSAPEGKKINILRKNNRVCIAFSTDHQMYHQHESMACSYSMFYKSVICYGKVEFIDNFEQKVEAMNIIMQQYTGKDFTYSVPSINGVRVYRVLVEEMTGKEFGNF